MMRWAAKLRRRSSVGALFCAVLALAALTLAAPESAETKREREKARLRRLGKGEEARSDRRAHPEEVYGAYEPIDQEKWTEVTALLTAFGEEARQLYVRSPIRFA
jgi:hypothetical protein